MRSRALLVALLVVLAATPFRAAFAGHTSTGGHSSSGSHSAGTVHVRGYTRADGTHVSGYTRSVPHSGHSTSKGTTRAPTAPPQSSLAASSHPKRSKAARDEFRREQPCPATGKKSGACPGYVVDHVQALKHGGADAPSNMQWQTIDAAKAKDKWE